MGKFNFKQFLIIIFLFLLILIHNNEYLFCCEPPTKCKMLEKMHDISESYPHSFIPEYEDFGDNFDEDWEVLTVINKRYCDYQNFFFRGILDIKNKVFLLTNIYHLVPIPSDIKIFTGENYSVYIKRRISYIKNGVYYIFSFSTSKFDSAKKIVRNMKYCYQKQYFYKV